MKRDPAAAQTRNRTVPGAARAAASALTDDKLFSFVLVYLARRYTGVKSRSFVAGLLEEFRDRGVEAAREKLSSPELRVYLANMYRRVEHRRFLFDACAFAPLLRRLPPDASVLDFGAGNNHFLPAMARRTRRRDIAYYAADYYAAPPARDGITFVAQPGPYEIPHGVGPFDLVLLRRTAHHVADFPRLIPELYNALKATGALVLIEDSFADGNPSVWPASAPLHDAVLTQLFYRSLNHDQRLTFLRFNDVYTNYLYHGWTTMPLPVGHRSFDGWETTFRASGLVLEQTYNLGFPRTGLNLHQAATGVLCWRKRFEGGGGHAGS